MTGRQIGHRVLLVQWHGGHKVVINPEAHVEAGTLEFPTGWRLIVASFQKFKLTRREDDDDHDGRTTAMKKTPEVRVNLEGGNHLAIGLMSGTSHDGVSAAVVGLDERATPRAKALAFRTFPYAPAFRERLLALASMNDVGAPAVSSINFELGKIFGNAAIKIAQVAKVPLSEISFIGSHGHTIFHLPPRTAARGQTPSTMQIGESSVIAAMTGLPVVADFRPMDMALGGEAAPLAPLAHFWLFGDRKLGRVIQNIGGIGNATYLKPGAVLNDPTLIAFDTGPGGMLIDALVNKSSGGKSKMDRDGRIAARGRVNEEFLAELMRHPYFRRRPPKSTGREEFGSQYLAEEIRNLRHTRPESRATI